MSKIWKTLSSHEIFKTRFFSLRSDKCELPDGRIMPDYYVCSFTPWCQVLPITKDKQVVFVKQYRHGIEKVTLEFPGGAVSSHEAKEAQKAAMRELQEETGYTSSRVQHIGTHNPNPAFQNNEMFSFIAWDCEKTHPQKLDPFEDIEVVLVPLKELPSLIYTGAITHSLIVAAFALALPSLKGHIDI